MIKLNSNQWSVWKVFSLMAILKLDPKLKTRLARNWSCRNIGIRIIARNNVHSIVCRKPNRIGSSQEYNPIYITWSLKTTAVFLFSLSFSFSSLFFFSQPFNLTGCRYYSRHCCPPDSFIDSSLLPVAERWPLRASVRASPRLPPFLLSLSPVDLCCSVGIADGSILVQPYLPIRSDPILYLLYRGEPSRRIPRACAARNERSPVLSVFPSVHASVQPTGRSPPSLTLSPYHHRLHLHFRLPRLHLRPSPSNALPPPILASPSLLALYFFLFFFFFFSFLLLLLLLFSRVLSVLLDTPVASGSSSSIEDRRSQVCGKRVRWPAPVRQGGQLRVIPGFGRGFGIV